MNEAAQPVGLLFNWLNKAAKHQNQHRRLLFKSVLAISLLQLPSPIYMEGISTLKGAFEPRHFVWGILHP